MLFLPFLLLGNTKHKTKWAMSADSAFPSALHALPGLRRGSSREARSVLVLDGASCPPFRYYTRLHPERARLRRQLAHFEPHCSRDFDGLVRRLRGALTGADSRAFALVSRARGIAEIQSLPEDLEIDAQQSFGKEDQLLVRVKRRQLL